MNNKLAKVRHIDGKICVKIQGMAVGEWYYYDNPVDSLLDHVRREIDPDISLLALCKSAKLCQTLLGKCRNNLSLIPAVWILKLHDLSGISIKDLRAVAELEPIVPLYSKKPRRRGITPIRKEHNPQPLRRSNYA